MIDLRAHAQCLFERIRAYRHNHELLKIQRVPRVHTTVDHIHRRHRPTLCIRSAKVAVQRQIKRSCCAPRTRKRDPKQSIRSQISLVVCSIQFYNPAIDQCLFQNIHTKKFISDSSINMFYHFLYTKSEIFRCPIAKLNCLKSSGACSGWHRFPSGKFYPVVLPLRRHFYLNSRIAARI